MISSGAERIPIWVRILVSIFIVAIIVLQYAVFENVRGKRALATWQGEMRARGEKVTLSDFHLEQSPTSNDGTAELLRACEELALLDDGGSSVTSYSRPAAWKAIDESWPLPASATELAAVSKSPVGKSRRK